MADFFIEGGYFFFELIDAAVVFLVKLLYLLAL